MGRFTREGTEMELTASTRALNSPLWTGAVLGQGNCVGACLCSAGGKEHQQLLQQHISILSHPAMAPISFLLVNIPHSLFCGSLSHPTIFKVFLFLQNLSPFLL